SWLLSLSLPLDTKACCVAWRGDSVQDSQRQQESEETEATCLRYRGRSSRSTEADSDPALMFLLETGFCRAA
ncbi:hypothetical protein AGIG_G25457, partial [Arapaima gigas]